MARKTRQKRRKKEELKLQPGDYEFPGEKQAYWSGVGTALGLFIVLAVMGFFIQKWYRGAGITTIWTVVVIAAYPFLALASANLLATRHSAQQIKEVGRQAKVMPNNHGELYRVLANFAKLGGMNPPNMYLLEDDAPYIYTIPGGSGTIVASTALRDGLAEDEFAALVVQQMGHIKSRHVRTALAVDYVTNANLAFKLLLFPLLLIRILSSGWHQLSDFSADRFAMLLVGRSSLLNKAMVKMALLADKQADITLDELQTYLDSTVDIATDAGQMERHFRLGQFISQQPNLQERIEQLREFPQEEQCRQAFEKMEEIRQQIARNQSAAG